MQAEALDAQLSRHGQQIDLVIQLDVDSEALMARIAKRFAEQGRADDNPDAYKVRLQAYLGQTAPLVAHYKQQGKLTVVDGMADVETVARSIDAALAAPRCR